MDRVPVVTGQLECDRRSGGDRAGKSEQCATRFVPDGARSFLEVLIGVGGNGVGLVLRRRIRFDVAFGQPDRTDIERDEAFGTLASANELCRAPTDVDDEVRGRLVQLQCRAEESHLRLLIAAKEY